VVLRDDFLGAWEEPVEERYREKGERLGVALRRAAPLYIALSWP
jgi:hypothetical protein